MLNHLKRTFRNIRSHKGYSFINITGLAIGMACFFLIGLWVRHELSFDRFHQNKDRIFRILNHFPDGSYVPSPTYALAPALKEIYPEVEEFARVWPWVSSLIKHEEKKFDDDTIIFTDPGFFRMFTFPVVQGERETVVDQPNAGVLTVNNDLRYFGKANPIVKVLDR